MFHLLMLVNLLICSNLRNDPLVTADINPQVSPVPLSIVHKLLQVNPTSLYYYPKFVPLAIAGRVPTSL
jgi:hypothetical protein